MRLDSFLASNGFFESRNKAQTAIAEGRVTVNGKKADKVSLDVGGDDGIDIAEEDTEFVGRGGIKLKYALDTFNIGVAGKKAVDIGASTGGFTQCLLRYGASRVYAIDCGSGQLHKSLSDDKRVVNIENFNAKLLGPEIVGGKSEIVTMDVSFISQTKLYEAVRRVICDGGIFISLIKPQFEVGKENIGKKGIVKSEKTAAEAKNRVITAAAGCGFECIGETRSPIKGGDGNTEYLAAFVYNGGNII